MSIDLNTLLPLSTDAAQRRERRCARHRAPARALPDAGAGPCACSSRTKPACATRSRRCCTERIADAREVQHTIDAYAHLLGDADAWTATLFIEMPDASRRDRELPVLSQAAHHLYLGCGGLPRVVAEANRDLADRHLGRPSGVHFLRFALARRGA
jgi:hypothetical protein